MATFFTDQALPSNSVSFVDHTLVLPALTLGNVGQLAIDLLLFTHIPHTLQQSQQQQLQQPTSVATRVGFIEDKYVIPVACNDVLSPPGSGRLSTALEVYQLADKKITFLQQRAPVITGRNHNFAIDLVQWIKSSSFKDVVLLVSADASFRGDAQLVGPQFRYITTPTNDHKDEARLKSLQWKTLENDRLDVVQKQGSFALALAEECNSKSVPLVSLSLFCFEGDNIPDAVTMADATNKFLQIVNTDTTEGHIQWRSPPSWAFIQGPTFETSLFQ